MACDRAGSSEGINVCTGKKPLYPLPEVPGAFPLRILPHAVEGYWNVGAVIPRSGKLFDELMASPPYRHRSEAEVLKELVTNPASPGRKALEEVAGKFNAALETLEAAGFPVRELVLSGGQAKSPFWNQFKADFTGRRLFEPEIPDAELAGNAVLGALALREGSPLDASVNFGVKLRERAAGMVRIKKRYIPGAKGTTLITGAGK
jgi:xylulokinase